MAKKINLKKIAKLFVQILLTIFAVWLLLSKIDINDVGNILSTSNPIYLVLAFIAFNISKIISAIRLNVFFSDIKLELSQKYNLILYYVGMFYNVFLPGGIGGDGYKIYILHKLYGVRILTLTKALLLDRISGLFALIFILSLFALFSSFSRQFPYLSYILIGVAILNYLAVYFIYKFRFKEFLSSAKTTNIQAILVQVSQVISVAFIILSFGNHINMIDMFVIFLVSSVVAVLPFTVGGIGARELTFVYLLELINQDYSGGVALSVIFFLITAVSSLIGAFLIYNTKLK